MKMEKTLLISTMIEEYISRYNVYDEDFLESLLMDYYSENNDVDYSERPMIWHELSNKIKGLIG